ncbi:MAG TPA: ZIP family metal transporter [Pirellulales bacterium]|jgi:zinc and cadmium transporter|nr:ZIP family metal transporter [Pirellulales bacterium]
MNPPVLAACYCVAIVLASLFGGSIPHWIRLTHTRMQLSLSFVAGVMLGVGLLHLIPHGYAALAEVSEATALDRVLWWALIGFLVIFFLERFFHFHHHEAPAADTPHDVSVCLHSHDHGHAHGSAHAHVVVPAQRETSAPAAELAAGVNAAPAGTAGQMRIAWGGALVGMTVHGLVDGISLAAAVQIEGDHSHGLALAGMGTFLAVFLHKPFDALTIGTLMAAGGSSRRTRHLVNAAYSLITPLGAALFFLGLTHFSNSQNELLGCILGFAGGAFLCIATSDLLPELQFHSHDRFRLSLALILGVALAWGIVFIESGGHDHHEHLHVHEHTTEAAGD